MWTQSSPHIIMFVTLLINITEAIGILYMLAIGLGSQILKDRLCQSNTQLGTLT